MSGAVLLPRVQVGYVKGVDISGNEIQEARRRFEEAKRKSRGAVRRHRLKEAGARAGVGAHIPS